MLVSDNHKESTLVFRTFLNLCLNDMYEDQKVFVKRETISYTKCVKEKNVREYMTFAMSDGKRFEIYVEKNKKFFKELK